MSLEQRYTGRTHYQPDRRAGVHRLFIAVECVLGELPYPVWALLDTAAEWCVIPPPLALDLGLDLDQHEGASSLHTRFGQIHGRLERLGVRFPADEGEALEVEATCFVSPDWPGPLVIGWKGCLEWFRFAIDPDDSSFYFGAP